MYIVSIFIAVINTLLNNHEKVNTSLAFIESQIFLPVISSKKSFSYKSDPVYGSDGTISYNGCIYGLIIMT